MSEFYLQNSRFQQVLVGTSLLSTPRPKSTLQAVDFYGGAGVTTRKIAKSSLFFFFFYQKTANRKVLQASLTSHVKAMGWPRNGRSAVPLAPFKKFWPNQSPVEKSKFPSGAQQQSSAHRDQLRARVCRRQNRQF